MVCLLVRFVAVIFSIELPVIEQVKLILMSCPWVVRAANIKVRKGRSRVIKI
jgi:hypothetical protein